MKPVNQQSNQNQCPVCGGNHLIGLTPINMRASSVNQEHKCQDCGLEWESVELN